MSGKAARAVDNDRSPRGHLASMTVSMMALWFGPTVDPVDLDEMPPRVGPAVLVAWTAAGVALGAILSVALIAVGVRAGTPRFAVAAPMFLPLLVGLVRLSERRVPALVLAGASGGGVGVAVGLTMPAVVGTYWGMFLAVSAAAMMASMAYGVVARPPSPAASTTVNSPTD